MGLTQIWETPDKKEVLMLTKVPFGSDSKNVLQTATLKGARLEKKEQIRICGNEPATLFMLSKENERQRIDAVVKSAGGATYLAMYIYSQDAKPNSQAESAIRDLCEK